MEILMMIEFVIHEYVKFTLQHDRYYEEKLDKMEKRNYNIKG